MGPGVGLRRSVMGLSVLGVAGSLAGGLLTGCGVAPYAGVTCNLKQAVLPAAATADHAAKAPGNQQAFLVGSVGSAQGCGVLPLAIPGPSAYTWFSSDPVNAPISNAKDATVGVATCVGATTVPVTISTAQNGTSPTATLTCK